MVGSCSGTMEIAAPTLDADITLSLSNNIISYNIYIGNPNNYNVYPVILTFTIDGLDCGPACGNLFGPQTFGANSPLGSFGSGSFNSSQYGGPGDHTICLILNIMGQNKQPICKTITVPAPVQAPVLDHTVTVSGEIMTSTMTTGPGDIGVSVHTIVSFGSHEIGFIQLDTPPSSTTSGTLNLRNGLNNLVSQGLYPPGTTLRIWIMADPYLTSDPQNLLGGELGSTILMTT